MNETLDYYDFGEDLLTSYDLDPIYPMIVQACMDDDRCKRWLLAYWCYYSAGVAAYIAEAPSKQFYTKMFEQYPTYPRGHERRHFRGEAGLKAIRGLIDFGAPERVVDYMVKGKDFQEIGKHVQAFTGFGPWIAWKVADMAERVLQLAVSFDNAELAVYRDPVQGAALLRFGDKHHPITTEELHDEVKKTLKLFRKFLAPPYQDRPLNIQEVETLFCKYKAHVGGHYPLGNDIHEVAHGLHGWGDLAQHLFRFLPKYD